MNPKTTKFANFFIFLSLLVAIPAFSQIAPLSGFAQDRYKEFKADSSVKYGTLENGVRYAIQRWPTPKNEVSLRMRIGAGSLNENEDQRGLMHFLEHMAFNGSKNVPENEFDRILEREGLAFGADTNAYTSFDEVVYQLDIPNPNKLDLGLMLMRETASNLTLAPEAIDRERGIIESEERARENPAYRVYRSYLREVFGQMRLTQRLPIGQMEIVKNAPRERFVEIYHASYTPKRTFIAVVGDIDVATAERILREKFGDWTPQSPEITDPNLGTITKHPAEADLVIEPQLPTSLTFTVPREYIDYPDTSEVRRMFLLQNLAESIVNERLEKIARRRDAPFTSAAISSSAMAKSVAYSSMEANAKTAADWDETLTIMHTELNRALRYGFDNDEFAAMVENTKAAYIRSAGQTNARRSASIVDSLVESFDNNSVYTSDQDDLNWFNQIAPTLNKEDALKELRALWGNEPPHLFISSSANIEGGIETINNKWRQIRELQIAPPQRQAQKTWDYNNFGTPAFAHSYSRIEDLGLSQIRFANGVRLNVKPTKFEEGRIRVNVRFGEGSLAISENNIWAGQIIESTFISGGLGRLEIDDMQRVLAGKSIGLSFDVDEDAFQFSGVTTKNDLLTQLQIFAAYYTDPAWRTEGFDRLKSQKDAIYRQIRNTPGAVWATNGAVILRNGDRRAAFPTEAEFDNLNFEAAKAILENARQNGAVEINIIGDVDVNSAINVVARTFGAMPKRANMPNPRSNERILHFPQGRNITTLTHDGRNDQALAMIFWPMRDYGDGSEVRALRVLESILQIKLNEIIREEEGGTYSPSTTWSPSTIYRNYGTLGASIEVKPNQLQHLSNRVEAIAQSIANGEIDADLLLRAKAPLIADFEETINNNPWWLNWLKNTSFDKSNLNVIRNGRSQYEQVTLERVKQLARQYLNPQKAQIIYIVPSDKATAPENTASQE